MKRILSLIAVFSFFSIVFLTVGILLWGVGNDYVLFEMNEATKDLVTTNVIKNDTAVQVEDTINIFNKYSSFSFIFDWVYLGMYIAFFIGSIGIAYFSREEDYFSFLSTLFWGILIYLFIVATISTFTDWWLDEILYKLISGVENILPKLNWINDNIGIISFIQMLLCVLANRFYFRIKEAINKNEFEIGGEVL